MDKGTTFSTMMRMDGSSCNRRSLCSPKTSHSDRRNGLCHGGGSSIRLWRRRRTVMIVTENKAMITVTPRNGQEITRVVGIVGRMNVEGIEIDVTFPTILRRTTQMGELVRTTTRMDDRANILTTIGTGATALLLAGEKTRKVIFVQNTHSQHTVVGVHPLHMEEAEEVEEAVATCSGEGHHPLNAVEAVANSFVAAHQLFGVVVVAEAGRAEGEEATLADK
mmetsp:Transcript_21859/g.51564  ORF Transcript_21859/g.51564 Transcript_21859/m.51564 type:complete len:222 (-) Transcript_21859:18-683(-)